MLKFAKDIGEKVINKNPLRSESQFNKKAIIYKKHKKKTTSKSYVINDN